MTIDIDAIRKRLAAATPGPWQHDGNDGLVWPERIGDPVSGSNEMADADFIAHTRTDIPALLAELDRVRADLAAAHNHAHRQDTNLQQITRAKNELANERDALKAENAELRREILRAGVA